MPSRGRLQRISECIEVEEKMSLLLILLKQFPDEFIVSLSSFRSYETQREVHFVKYDHIRVNTDSKTGADLGRGNLLTEMPWNCNSIKGQTRGQRLG